MKPMAAAAAVAVAVVDRSAEADKSANAAGSYCAARVYGEETGRRVDCVG